MKTKLITICILTCVLFCSTSAFARRVYVKLASDATAWSHITEDNDHKIITIPGGSTDFTQHVLIQLQQFDEVWVAKGVYTNTGKLTLYNDENLGLVYGNITLYGGFAGTETNPSQRALFDKDENGLIEPWEFVNETNFRGAGNSSANASNFQMIHLGQNSVLDGVTISDNYYTATNVASGGVIATSATIRKCIVRDLTTAFPGNTTFGGGFYVTGGHVESCLFETCAAIAGNDESDLYCYGGALNAYGFQDNQPGTPTGSIRNSVIRNCRAGKGNNRGRGGAIFGKNGLIIENCVMYNNIATLHGGAFFFHNNGDANKHVNRLINCTVVNNCSMDANSRSACFADCDYAEFYNCVFWGNPNTDYPQTADAYVNTFRLRANNASVTAYPFIDGFAFNGTIQNSNANKNAGLNPITLNTPIVGGFDAAAGGVDPKFTNPTPFQGLALNAADLSDIRKANFTLQAGSPLIDAGVNAPTNQTTGYDVASLPASFSGTDIRGAVRNIGAKFDIGAYEFGAQTGVPGLNKTSYRMYANNSILTVSNLDAPASINIYAANGVLISSVKTSASSVNLPLQNKGFYIVILNINNNSYSQKIIN